MEIKQQAQVESAPVVADAELITDNQVDTCTEELPRKLIKTFREQVRNPPPIYIMLLLLTLKQIGLNFCILNAQSLNNKAANFIRSCRTHGNLVYRQRICLQSTVYSNSL